MFPPALMCWKAGTRVWVNAASPSASQTRGPKLLRSITPSKRTNHNSNDERVVDHEKENHALLDPGSAGNTSLPTLRLRAIHAPQATGGGDHALCAGTT